jgi:hypothetical protein
MALRTVNPWLDHRHDGLLDTGARAACSPDERSDIRVPGVEGVRMSQATRYSLLPTLDFESAARGGREPGSEKHPQGANSDPETRPIFLKLRLHPIVAHAA